LDFSFPMNSQEQELLAISESLNDLEPKPLVFEVPKQPPKNALDLEIERLQNNPPTTTASTFATTLTYQANADVPMPASSAFSALARVETKKSETVIDLTNERQIVPLSNTAEELTVIKKEPLTVAMKETLYNMSFEEASKSEFAEQWEEIKDMDMIILHGRVARNKLKGDQFDRLLMEVIGMIKLKLAGRSGFDWRINWESVRVTKSEETGDYIVSIEVFGENTAKVLKNVGLPIEWIEFTEEVIKLEQAGVIRHRKTFAIFARPVTAAKEAVKNAIIGSTKVVTEEDFDIYLHADWTANYFDDTPEGRTKAYQVVQDSITSPIMIGSEAIVFGLPYKTKKNLPTIKVTGWSKRAPESRTTIPKINKKLASDCGPNARIYCFEVLRNRVSKFQGCIFAYVIDGNAVDEAARSLNGYEIGKGIKLQAKPTKGVQGNG